jgi:hypothetical protein
MTDAPTTPEAVALSLLHLVARIEGKSLDKAVDGQAADRKWLLDTYADCLRATKGTRPRGGPTM